MFYEIKLKVEKENSKGEMKEVVEHFITDVELFAEAEAMKRKRSTTTSFVPKTSPKPTASCRNT